MYISKKVAALSFLLGIVALAVYLLSEPCGIPVLNYHQINDRDENFLTISSAQFTAQMDYLRENGYHTITAEELANALERGAKLPEKPVLITFDDGYLDNYKHAYPILKERNMHALIFLISDYMGLYPNYVTWDMAREMQQNGIEFGSHTLSHTVLIDETPAELANQLVNSKLAIEWHLGTPVAYLAYPCGDRNETVIERAQAAGYRAAFTVDFGRVQPGDAMMELRRIPIFGGNNHTLFRFKMRLLCPNLTHFLKRAQQDVEAAGFPWIANHLIPVF